MKRDAIDKIEGIGVYLAPRPLITVLGVKYLHLCVEDGTDLYVTEHGLPFAKCLMPENHWADQAWMERHGVRLPGTSALHRVTTKSVDGRSKEIVIKWNRMGQDIPGETQVLEEAEAEFNSPFMEFSLVIELRKARFESPGRLHTHKPLAIYVPRKYVKGEHLGRKRHKMEAIQRIHDEIPIDWNRNYAVIYEWLKGIDTVEASKKGLLANQALSELVQRSVDELGSKAVRRGPPRFSVCHGSIPAARPGHCRPGQDVERRPVSSNRRGYRCAARPRSQGSCRHANLWRSRCPDAANV